MKMIPRRRLFSVRLIIHNLLPWSRSGWTVAFELGSIGIVPSPPYDQFHTDYCTWVQAKYTFEFSLQERGAFLTRL